MLDKEIAQQIAQLRVTAREMGEEAIAAINRGDAGLARATARQAAQWARVVIQLETGQRMVEPEDAEASGTTTTSPAPASDELPI